MAGTSPIRQQLLKAVEQIIPCVREDNFRRMVLAQPPMVLPPEVGVTMHRGRPLAENVREHSHAYLHHWREQQLHSIYFPCLGYVLEGEIDWRIGVTRSMAKTLPEPFSHCDYQVLVLPEQTFFLMPPGVPFSRGEVHWEPPRPTPAPSRVFWLNVLPSGAFCHLCHTQHGEHVSDAILFVRDAHLAPAVELLSQELQTRAPHFEVVARTQLLALMLRIGRALAEHKAFESDAEEAESTHQQGAREWIVPINEHAVKRACAFIETHLHEPLTPAMVAAHAHMSPSHLNRLFRGELGLSIMKQVTVRRLETAKSLLCDSDLPVHQVGRLVGYSNPSHFTQIFSQGVHTSPLEYRKHQRNNAPRKNKR